MASPDIASHVLSALVICLTGPRDARYGRIVLELVRDTYARTRMEEPYDRETEVLRRIGATYALGCALFAITAAIYGPLLATHGLLGVVAVGLYFLYGVPKGLYRAAVSALIEITIHGPGGYGRGKTELVDAVLGHPAASVHEQPTQANRPDADLRLRRAIQSLCCTRSYFILREAIKATSIRTGHFSASGIWALIYILSTTVAYYAPHAVYVCIGLGAAACAAIPPMAAISAYRLK